MGYNQNDPNIDSDIISSNKSNINVIEAEKNEGDERNILLHIGILSPFNDDPVIIIKQKEFKMKEEFSKYDKVVYDGEVFEVLETADNTRMMKIEPLFDETYKSIWADEEMVVSLNRAIKLRLIDDETADEAINFGKPK